MPTDSRPGEPSLEQAVKEFLDTRPGPRPPAAPRPAASASTPVPESDPLRTAFDRVLQHEAEKAAEVRDRPVPLWRRALGPTIVAILGGCSVYVWLGRPAWLYPPAYVPVPPASAAAGERALMTIALVMEAYRTDRGHPPRTLEDLNLDVTGVALEMTDGGGYRLSRTRGDLRWVLTLPSAGGEPVLSVVHQGKDPLP